ncbi:hypothetical protein H8D36_01480 [archaeon]|nr:hypothetical protein [archaeon]
MMKKIEIVKPTINDLETIVAVEKAAWPDIGDGMVAEYDKFKTRIELGLMYLLYLNNTPAGIISFQQPAFTNPKILNNIHQNYKENGLLEWTEIVKKHGLPKDWYEATNNGYINNGVNSTHNKESNCIFLIGVGIDSALKGHGLVNHMINHTIVEAKKDGTEFVLGYGRLPQMHEDHTSATVHDAEKHLLKQKPSTNLPADYGARFHVFNGAKAVSVIPNAMDDPESLDYGFLALYKLK